MRDHLARHGGPFDRGAADSYYRRGFHPHYYTGASMQSERVEEADMTEKQIAEYRAGYDENERDGFHKEY